LPQIIIFAALCGIELLNQSLAEELPQCGFIFILLEGLAAFAQQPAGIAAELQSRAMGRQAHSEK
jgi:hypothetical protein